MTVYRNRLLFLSEILGSFEKTLKNTKILKSTLNWPVPDPRVIFLYQFIAIYFIFFIYLVLKKEKKIVCIVKGGIKKPEKFSIAC